MLLAVSIATSRTRERPCPTAIGVAGYPTTRAETVEQLLEAADQALYRAKREGRNRVSG